MVKNQILSGKVIAGKQLGRELGFPTANVDIDSLGVLKSGVWFVKVWISGNDRAMFGVANIGVRPTVDNNLKPLLEVFVFDFSGDLYGEEIKVEFHTFLRYEQKYNSLSELKSAIENDVALGRKILKMDELKVKKQF